jgi:hypothetical protein
VQLVIDERDIDCLEPEPVKRRGPAEHEQDLVARDLRAI